MDTLMNAVSDEVMVIDRSQRSYLFNSGIVIRFSTERKYLLGSGVFSSIIFPPG